jgi:hypothetical protein
MTESNINYYAADGVDLPNDDAQANNDNNNDNSYYQNPSEEDAAGLTFTRTLMFYGYGSVTEENVQACTLLQEGRTFRKKYIGGAGVNASLLEGGAAVGRWGFGQSGIVELYATDDPSDNHNMVTIPTVFEFMKDYNRLVRISQDGATRSFSFQRLQLLSSAFKSHTIANGHVEHEAQSRLLGTDFYRTPKCDNHIHLAAAASAKQFVDFVRDKLENEPDTVVLEEGDTLKEVFDKAGLDADHLTIDAFNVLADYSVYQRFDNFNSKYSPFKLAQMRRIFLKVRSDARGEERAVCLFSAARWR